jgi:DMSO/TMAO reductase YedYZ molybdopterin-dependent catalytic subunit
MAAEQRHQFPPIGDGSSLDRDGRLHPEEVQLAFRNGALPLEALRYDVTPAGLHYTLSHYDIPALDPADWRLTIEGQFERPLNLSLAELQRRPSETLRVTFECAGDGRALLDPRPISQPWQEGAVGTAEWTGTPLRALLDEAGLDPAAAEVVFIAHDRGIEGGREQDYAWGLARDEALRDDVLLAWAMNGQPLLPQHGAPLRLIVPGWYGMASVKWLRGIVAVDRPFDGYHQTIAYRYSQTREEPGEPVSLMRVRSLLLPPGLPDFLTRTRIVKRGAVTLRGRAWSGRAAITRVEVSADGGASWFGATVGPAPGPYAWQPWEARWDADTPGDTVLLCRAHDATGAVQPIEQFWTARGMGNNMAHRVPVRVVE